MYTSNTYIEELMIDTMSFFKRADAVNGTVFNDSVKFKDILDECGIDYSE